jgi:hypothetical protein
MSIGEARKRVRERSGGECELRIFNVCFGRAETMHHRRKQSQGGPWVPSNLIHTCGDGTRGCHGLITNTRTVYYDNGWIVHSWENWRTAKVLLWNGLRYLDNAGGFEPPPTCPLGCAVWTSNEKCDHAEEAS